MRDFRERKLGGRVVACAEGELPQISSVAVARISDQSRCA